MIPKHLRVRKPFLDVVIPNLLSLQGMVWCRNLRGYVLSAYVAGKHHLQKHRKNLHLTVLNLALSPGACATAHP